MRLNKEIREYIENLINDKAMENAKLKELKAAYDAEKEEMEARVTAIVDEANAKLAQLCEETGFKHKSWNGELCPITVEIRNFARNDLPAYEPYNDLKRELSRQAQEKTKEVFVSIQLGGSKDDLMQTLDDITF